MSYNYAPILRVINIDANIIEVLNTFINKLKFNTLGYSRIATQPRIEQADITKRFVDLTFYLLDQKELYCFLKAITEHQIRVIQYYRIFIKHIYPELADNLKEIYMERFLQHDSDKLTDINTLKYYLASTLLGEIQKKLKGKGILQTIIYNIRNKILKKIHHNYNRHHEEYFTLNTKKLLPIDSFETAIDLTASADKYNEEMYGQKYKKQDLYRIIKQDKKHNELMEATFDGFNKYFKKTTKSQEHATQTTRRNNTKTHTHPKKYSQQDQIQKALEHDKILYAPLEDGYDENMKLIKSICRNLSLLICHKWKEIQTNPQTKTTDKKTQITELLTLFPSIAKYKEKLTTFSNGNIANQILSEITEIEKEMKQQETETRVQQLKEKEQEINIKLAELSAIICAIRPTITHNESMLLAINTFKQTPLEKKCV